MKRAAAALAATVLILATGSVSAQVLKCTGADGKAVFSDRPGAATQRTETLVAPTRPAAALLPAQGATATGAHGLSFALANSAASPTAVAHLGCHGEPSRLDRPHRNSCNPYQGDTSCRASLPVACIKSTGAKAPDKLEQDFYKGWVDGQLGATKPVRGSTLTSERAASTLCEAELGAGWRMAEFHDGHGGWGLQGERAGGIAPGTRYWVHINDQPGNCWDSRP